MIENKDTLKYIEIYFYSIKNSLPANSVFTSAYKYNNQTNHNQNNLTNLNSGTNRPNL